MTLVFKYGGHALPQAGTIDPTITYLASLIKSGTKVILVHGGGPQINKELEVHGIESEMVNGFRKTTPEVFSIVQRTLSGEVLRNIVNQFISAGINAVGLSAGDGGLVRGIQKDLALGLVGVVDHVDPSIVISLLNQGFTPVISPIGVDVKGQGLNMNADLVAGAIGGALKSECVYFSTDVSGIYRSWPDKTTLIDSINSKDLQEISKDFKEGMIPKAQAVLNAIKSGAKSARIFDGRETANVELAIAGSIGTLVMP